MSAAVRPTPVSGRWRLLVDRLLTFTARRVIAIVGLAALWCGLWGSASFANVLSGLVVGVVATLSMDADTGGVRLVSLAKFVLLVVVDLVKSTYTVAKEVLTPPDNTDEGIIVVSSADISSRRHLLALTIAITVTPGTAVVEVDQDTGELYLHILHYDKRDDVMHHALELAQVAADAFPDRDGAADSASRRRRASGGHA